MGSLISCIGSEKRVERNQFKQELAQVQSEIRSAQNKELQQISGSNKNRQKEFTKIISQYESFLESGTGEAQEKAIALRRLADLYIELEQDRFLEKMATYEQEIEKIPDEKKTSFPPPQQDFRKAISLYEQLIRQYPNYEDRDQIYYQLASSFDQMGEIRKSIYYMNLLVRKFPNSKYLQEIYFRLGEFSFDRNQFDKAEAFYREGTRLKDNQLYFVNTLYKLGWTYYLQEKFLRSADIFRQLLDLKKESVQLERINFLDLLQRPQAKKLGGQIFEAGLRGDSLLMMARCFSELENAITAERYFQRVGDRPYRSEIYRALVENLAHQDRIRDSEISFQIFLKNFPLHKEALKTYESMIKMFERQNDYKNVAVYRQKLIQFSFPNGPWVQANETAEKKYAMDLRQNSIRSLANYYHHFAQKNKQKESFKNAIKWYNLFVIDYPHHQDIPEVEFLMAECRFEIGDYKEAGKLYEKVSNDHPKKERKIQAAGNAFEAYFSKFTEEKKHSPPLVIRSILRDIRRSRYEYQHIAKIDNVLKKLLLKEGNAFYEVKEYQLCRSPLQFLLQKYTDSQEAFWASRLLGLSYFHNGEYLEASKNFMRTLSLTTAVSSKEITNKDIEEVRELYASSLFKRAEEMEKSSGSSNQIAKAYEKVFESSSSAKIAPSALQNAAIIYVNQKDEDKAMEVLHKLISKYPKHPETYIALVNSAKKFSETNAHKNAAEAYYLSAQVAPKLKDKKDALYAAGMELEKGASSKEIHELSKKTWNKLLAEFRNTKNERVEYLYRLAQAYQKNGEKEEAINTYQKCRQSHQGNHGDESVYYAARSELEIGKFYQEHFNKISLVKPFRENLEKKKKYLNLSLNAFGEAAKYREAEVTPEATHRIGMVLEDFSSSLKESPTPNGLNKEEEERYRFLLEEQAFPFEEKALASYQSNIRVAQASKIHNLWIQKSYERLVMLAPGQYGRIEKNPLMESGVNFF